MDYLELRSWRDICEYLNSCWYKFAEPTELQEKCKGAIASLWQTEGRAKRQLLWDRWLIQFIRWGNHPILNFRSSKENRRRFNKHYRGWILVSGWEAKIDFLEQLIILERDETILAKPWEAAIRESIEEREAQNAIYSPNIKLLQLSRLESGLCPHCGIKQIALMFDCPQCKKPYEFFL